GSGLVGGDLPDGVVTGVAPAGQGHPPRRAGGVDPGHRPVGGDQPAPPAALHRAHRGGARVAGLGGPGGRRGGPGRATRAAERGLDHVLHVAATAGMVLPGRPESPAAPRLAGSLAVSGLLAGCRGGHGFSLRQLAALDWAWGSTSLFAV